MAHIFLFLASIAHAHMRAGDGYSKYSAMSEQYNSRMVQKKVHEDPPAALLEVGGAEVLAKSGVGASEVASNDFLQNFRTEPSKVVQQTFGEAATQLISSKSLQRPGKSDMCVAFNGKRTGNALCQLMNSIMCAKTAGKDGLRLSGWERKEIADLPSYIPLHVKKEKEPFASSVAFGNTGRRMRKEPNCCPKLSGCCELPDDGKLLSAKRSAAQRYIVPYLSCNSSSGFLSEVVLHMRSGDVMTNHSRSGVYPQPPCSFYEKVILTGNSGAPFPDVRIVTESDRRNPCLEYLNERFGGKVVVQSGSLQQDVCTIVNARNLVSSFGTFVPALALLNTKLDRLYIPFGEDSSTHYGGQLAGMSLHWYKMAFSEEPTAFEQHLYSFPGYVTTWISAEDRASKMKNYPAVEIIERVIASSRRS